MRHRLLLQLAAATGLAASCASVAMMTPAPEAPEPAPVAEAPEPAPVGVTLTPVTVEAGGRITPLPQPDTVPPEPEAAALAEAEGEATYYASKFDGRRTASGIVFRNAEAYAAHRTWPFGTVVRVTSLVNDRSVIVKVVDRGPFGTSARARRTIIDLSQSVARELDFMRAGRIPVRVEVLEWGTGRK